ncbi:MAG: GHKL domain-containing protein, partial [Defluviitaleaceae bacterium]|nr:GHKL domain-containing protein [Defluviitaleaceae bacterium]
MLPSPLILFLRDAIIMLGLYASTKIITRRWKGLSQNLYLLCAALVTALLFAAHKSSPFTNIERMVDMIPIGILILYFAKVEFFPLKKAIVLTSIVIYTQMFVQAIFTMAGFHLNWVSMAMFGHSVSDILLHSVAATLAHFVFFAVGMYFARRPLQRLLENNQMLTIAAWGVSLTYLVPATLVAVFQWRMPYDFLWAAIPPGPLMAALTVAVAIPLACLIFYFRIYAVRQNTKMREAAQRDLEYYTQELEKQHLSMRQFRHDYKNILVSMSGFIQERDWEGLAAYYGTKIEKASALITKNNFTLDRLANIKVKEIKSILVSKLILAQNLDIDTAFEVDGDIDHICVDSVDLVRMLGIIMDNAIEELASQASGKLQVACYKIGASVTFVVQNTCCRPVPHLRQLTQAGFSTKGEGRGLGLHTLEQLVDAYPNITLRTCAKDDEFTQQL